MWMMMDDANHGGISDKNDNGNQSDQMSALPAELLPNVLRHLSVEECVRLGEEEERERKKGKRCAIWRGALQDPLVWNDRQLKLTDCRWLARLKAGSAIYKANNLDLSQADLDDNSLAMIADHFACLKSVSLANSRHLTDFGLEFLLQRHGPNIHHLNLSRCFRLTNRALECVTEKCLKLKRLDLTGCLFSTAALKMLCEGSMARNLQRLSLSRCHLIDPIQFPLLLPMLSKLRVLDLSHLDGLMPYQCDALLGSLGSLRKMCIVGCPEFTLRNVRDLQNKTPRLSLLHDAKLEDHTVDAIRRYLLGLTAL